MYGIGGEILSEAETLGMMPQLLEIIEARRMVSAGENAFNEVLGENNVNNLSEMDIIVIVSGVLRLGMLIKKGTVHPSVIRAAFVSNTQQETARVIFNDDTYNALGAMYVFKLNVKVLDTVLQNKDSEIIDIVKKVGELYREEV